MVSLYFPTATACPRELAAIFNKVISDPSKTACFPHEGVPSDSYFSMNEVASLERVGVSPQAYTLLLLSIAISLYVTAALLDDDSHCVTPVALLYFATQGILLALPQAYKEFPSGDNSKARNSNSPPGIVDPNLKS